MKQNISPRLGLIEKFSKFNLSSEKGRSNERKITVMLFSIKLRNNSESRTFLRHKRSEDGTHEDIVPFNPSDGLFLIILIYGKHMSSTWDTDLHSYVSSQNDVKNAKCRFDYFKS
jgi:hypothetical protein